MRLPSVVSVYHLKAYVGSGPDAYLFTTQAGQPMRRATLYKRWNKAVQKVGLQDFAPHNLRHTANVIAADSGVSTQDLMARMGHASSRAALIYQHASQSQDQAIADAISAAIRKPKSPSDEASTSSGTDRARLFCLHVLNAVKLHLTFESGRRVSNPRHQFGKLRLYH